MKSILLASCLVGITLTAHSEPMKLKTPQSEKSLKILAIGNSFSQDALRHVYQISTNAGIQEVVLGNLYIGGCPLSKHWNNAQTGAAQYDYQKNVSGEWVSSKNTTIESGILDEDWDIITIQQVSSLSGDPATYNSDLDNLIRYVNSKKTNPHAKLAWHMTWAYQSDSGHPGFAKYDKNQETMYQAILSAVSEKIVGNSALELVIPSGTAIQNMRTSYVGDTLTRDGFHLSYNLGRYIAGLTWFKTLTGQSIDNITWVPDSGEIPNTLLPAIKEAVNQATETPFAITESSHKADPLNNKENYRLLDWKPDGLGYWHSRDGGYADQPQITRSGIGPKFIPSGRRFTKVDIPVGSLIEADAGIGYRPEGWAAKGKPAPGRPGKQASGRIIVTEKWWDGFEHRAFNIFQTGMPKLTGKEAETAKKFRIYVPLSTGVK